MADRQPITIVREAVHIVKHWTPDNYGNILVTVAEQEEPIKISSKRANLADKIIADTQFKFKYANYMNRDYVADIECMETDLPAEVKSPPAIVKEPAPQAVGMVTKEMGDMYRAGKLSEIFGVEAGIELVKWYRNQVLGITKVPYDGAKLPTFRKKDEKRQTEEE